MCLCSACRCADVGRRGNRCCGGSVSELELPAHPHLQCQLGPRGWWKDCGWPCQTGQRSFPAGGYWGQYRLEEILTLEVSRSQYCWLLVGGMPLDVLALKVGCVTDHSFWKSDYKWDVLPVMLRFHFILIKKYVSFLLKLVLISNAEVHNTSQMLTISEIRLFFISMQMCKNK